LELEQPLVSGFRGISGSGPATIQTDPLPKRKRAAQPLFEVERWAIGGGYYVRATLTDGTVERIEGFASEGEAGRWIKNEAGAWLHSRRNDNAVNWGANGVVAIYLFLVAVPLLVFPLVVFPLFDLEEL
jgi:hypothetical protein